MVFLFTSPQRSLVSSDLPPVCIRKERLYRPAHSWYLISLQALGANPTTFVLPVSRCMRLCVCVCMYRHAHLLVTTLHWLLSLICSVQEGNRTLAYSWLYSPAANISSHSFFSRNFILHFYFKCISTPTVSLTVQRPQFPGAPVLLTMGGHSPLEFGYWSTGKQKKIQNLPFFFAYFQQMAGIFKEIIPSMNNEHF